MFIFRLLAILVSLGFLAACSENASESIQIDIAQTAKGLEGASIPTEIAEGDAESIAQAAVLLAEGATSKFKEKFIRDDLTKQLIERAQTQIKNKKQFREEASFSAQELQSLPEEEKRSALRYFETAVQEYSERIAISTAKEAIEQQFIAEATLDMFLTELRGVSPNIEVPIDPLFLAPAESISAAIANLSPQMRRLEERVAVYDTPESRASIKLLEEQISRFRMVLNSEEYRKFQKAKEKLYVDINLKTWRVKAGLKEKDERVVAAVERRWREAEQTNSELKDAFLAAHWSRGPPSSSIDAEVFASIRDYDLDPQRWSHAEAKLQALADSIHNLQLDELGSDSPLRNHPGRKSVLPLLREDSLANFKRFLNLWKVNSDETSGPKSTGMVDRDKHFEGWLDDVNFELVRRQGTAAHVNASSYPAVVGLVKDHISKRGKGLSDLAKAKLLAILQSRYHDIDEMPIYARQELREIISEAIWSYESRIVKSVKRLNKLNDKLALSTESVREGLLQDYHKFRTHLATSAWALSDSLKRASDSGVVSGNSESEKDFKLALLLIGPRPPPEKPSGSSSNGSEEKLPPDSEGPKASFKTGQKPPPSVGPMGPAISKTIFSSQSKDLHFSTLHLKTDPKIEKDLVRAELLLGEIEPEIDKLSIKPIAFASSKGRRVVSATFFNGGNIRWKAVLPDNSKTRLPFKLKSWMGLADKGGNPYNYQKVVINFKSLDVVGGGIHFGHTARLQSPHNLSELFLSYDLERKELQILTYSGEKYTLDIEPDELKALYQFVTSDRNAAISIGWAGGLEKTFKQSEDEVTVGSRPILLDPFFVDTRIGQNLILVDQIPWHLDKKNLPNNRTNPIQNKFKKALADWNQEKQEILRPIFVEVKPFNETRKLWIKRLKDSRYGYGPFLKALLSSSTTQEAIRKISRDINSKNEVHISLTKPKENKNTFDRTKLPQSWWESLNRSPNDAEENLNISRILSQQKLYYQGPESGRILQLNDDVQALTYEMQAGLQRISPAQKFVEENNLGERLPTNSFEAFNLTVNSLTSNILKGKDCDPMIVKLWGSLAMENQHIDSNDLSLSITNSLDITTLAVLMDDQPTEIILSNGRIQLANKLKYRYVTRWVSVENGCPKLGSDPADKENQVQDLPKLTTAANSGLLQIQKLYPPLEKVSQYSRIASFLRWAHYNKESLAGIDLSSLASVPVSGTKIFPTLDAIRN